MRDGQLEAWLITLAVEGVAAAALARFFGVVPSRAARAAIAGSLCSHPIVWYLFFRLIRQEGYWTTFAIVESFAVLSEAPFYRLAGARWPTAVLLSLLVNVASVLAGFARYAAW